MWLAVLLSILRIVIVKVGRHNPSLNFRISRSARQKPTMLKQVNTENTSTEVNPYIALLCSMRYVWGLG